MSALNLDCYYWDACIFLEHFRINEPVSETKRQAIKRILADNRDQKNIIITSAITHLEVLPSKIVRDDYLAEEKYWSMFGTRFFYEVATNGPIIKLAREIREFYFIEGNPKAGISYRMMDTGDAIHLATAIINDVTEFHTRDNKSRKGNVPLLGLHTISPGGRIAGQFDLKISSPEEAQLDLLSTEGLVDANEK